MQFDIEESPPIGAFTLQYVRKTRKEPLGLNVRGWTTNFKPFEYQKEWWSSEFWSSDF